MHELAAATRWTTLKGKARARARAELRQGMVKSNLALVLPVQLHVHVVWRERVRMGEHIYARGEHTSLGICVRGNTYPEETHITVRN